MKITVNEEFGLQLEEVFNGVTLKAESGETMSICMRDTGFEFKYQDKMYLAKDGVVKEFARSTRGNYLVEQNTKCSEGVDVVSDHSKQKFVIFEKKI